MINTRNVVTLPYSVGNQVAVISLNQSISELDISEAFKPAEAMVYEAAKANSLKWGIYSSNGVWQTLFASAQAVVELALKFAFSNSPQPNYDDWNNGMAFGGFSAPSGKENFDSN
ncbi:12953_t:CDS:2 [Gigaspora rosea]|nr:12953_t:CDS:2 [Gigaspora rosea]